MTDIAIPIVFPDYLIAVNTPKTRVIIPDLLPGFDILPDNVEVPETQNKFPELGHAGILFINGSSGTTKYYEYGRYGGSLGAVRKLSIRDVIMQKDHPTKASLSYTLSQISIKSGQGGRISGAYIEVPNQYKSMLNYAQKRHLDNKNPKRKAYDLFSNSCNHFMKGVLEAAGVDVPYMLDPRPNSYIEEIRDDFKDLDYSKATHTLKVEDAPQSLAFSMRITQPASA
jgi:hypothetical protein